MRVLTTMLWVLSALPLRAQASTPVFEVATIKPARNWSPAVTFPSAGHLLLGGDNLAGIIRYAYDAGLGTNKEITGGPGWIYRDLYSVEAKAEGSPNIAEYQAMLRALLEERFALKLHTAPKTVDVYALVQARSDGELGPKAQPFSGECGALRMPGNGAGKGLAPKQVDSKEAPYSPQPNPDTPPHGCLVYFGGPKGILLEGAPMAFLARMLSTLTTILGRPVVDRTGLTGRFNLQLDLEFPVGPRQKGAGPQTEPFLFAPSLFVALQNQLGLKLEAAKGSIETIVVDAAERPTGN